MSDEPTLAITELSYIREAITDGQARDLKGFGQFAAAEITALRAEVGRLRGQVAAVYLENGKFSSFSAVRVWDAENDLLSPLLGEDWRDLKHEAARKCLATLASLNDKGIYNG